jgi:hypothetical protein
MSKENGIASNDTILLPNVAVLDEADVEPHVVATAEQNMATVDEAIVDQSSVAQISQLVSKMVLDHN